jgi:hypothetical protein
MAGKLTWPGLIIIGAIPLPDVAQAQSLSFNELTLGVLDHDVHFLGGKEKGIDFNPEVKFESPISYSWAQSLPWYLSWTAQPRPTVGAQLNSLHYTNQYYLGATWTWQVLSDVLQPGDGVTVGWFFGPGFNDGEVVATQPDRKSLGSNVLFREALEVGYRITPQYQISVYMDHVSNGGLDRENQSLNDIGARIGIRF